MADMEQVQIVRRGRDPVAKWREDHPGESMDLFNSYMSHVRIPQVDLSGADLRESDFMGAMLRRANLANCALNAIHLYRADLREANLTRALLNRANLRGADLRGADLQNADLDQAVLSGANLSGVNLTGANLSRTNLDGTNFSGANLTNVNLNGAGLTRTDLSEAIFDGADFYEARLNNPNLAGAKFNGSLVGYTVFQNCDFGGAEGLEGIRHDAPSTVGVDSLMRSAGQIPEVFLQGIGAPESLIGFQKTLQGAATVSEDYFISCTDQDVPFAQNLQANLRARGIRCWLFTEAARGNALVDRRSVSDEEEVERWVRHYNKLIVVCSQASFDSEIVRNDVTAAKERQESQDEWVLFLVAPDDVMIDARARPVRTLKSEHKVFDLRGQDTSSDAYQQELSSMAECLVATQPASAGVPAYDDQL